ncbi:hypothetical protein BDV12DRAFT_206392 [Aspergillus spectabilis]
MQMPSIFLPLLLVQLAGAITVQDLWVFPRAPDFSSDITTGTTIQIRWQQELTNVFSTYCTQCDTTDVDLWLTGSNYDSKLKGTNGVCRGSGGINVQTTLSYSWTVNLNASIIKSSPDWSVRFLPSGSVWNGTGGQEVTSPQFNILAPPQTSSTTSPTSTTTTGTTTASSTSATATSPWPAVTSATANNNNSLSSGAKAGVSVGAAVGGIFIIALFIFFWRKIRAIKSPIPPIQVASDSSIYPAPGHHTSGHYMEVQQVPVGGNYMTEFVAKKNPSELPVADRLEMDAGLDGQRRPFELDASRQQVQ